MQSSRKIRNILTVVVEVLVVTAAVVEVVLVVATTPFEQPVDIGIKSRMHIMVSRE